MESTASTIERLAPWFHNIHLPDGVQTAPHHFLGDFPAYKWRVLAPHLPADLSGWTALDIGCNAGYYTVELAKRGAHVTAIDVDAHYLDQARWVVDQFSLNECVTFQQMQVYDLARISQQFDLVLFMGVFYHLRYPMLGMDIAAQKVKRLMVFQSLTIPGSEVYENTHTLKVNDRDALREAGFPKMAFIEHALEDDPTNWWVPNHAGVQAILRAAGLRLTASLSHEIYLCEPNPQAPSAMTTWLRGEYLSATGQKDSEHDD